MKTLTRVLRALYGAAFVALVLYGMMYLAIKFGGFTPDVRSLALLSVAVAFSISRPHHRHGLAIWLVYDGLVVFFMMLAFRDVGEMVGLFEAAFMRLFGYLNLYSWSWTSTAALAVSSAAWFFVFGASVPPFVMLVVCGAIVLGGIVSLEFSEELVEEDEDGQGLDV